jgi:FkbM family methyltransferase
VSILRSLLPAGAERWPGWSERFRELGLSRGAAWRASADGQRKRAYQASRIGQLPPRLRRELRCVIDVGANQGQWADALLSLASPARMEVFEPNPEAFARLAQRIGGRPGVRLHALALGPERGELPLRVTADSVFASFLQPMPEIAAHYGEGALAVTREVRVPVEPLDAVLHDGPCVDLLKLDVQGFERNVIAGARATLQRTRALLVEANFVPHYRGDESLDTLTALLREHGFSLWDLSPPLRAADGRPLWCDAVFTNERLVAECC